MDDSSNCGNQAEWASGNIFIRRCHLAKAGGTIHGHTHNFDHTTIVFKGTVRVATERNGSAMEQTFVAPAHFLVRKDQRHEITALVDDTEFWCVYAHRTPQGEVVQERTGWAEAYD